MLDRGTHSEMLLDQNLHFSENELQDSGSVTGSRPNIGLQPDLWRKDSDSGRIFQNEGARAMTIAFDELRQRWHNDPEFRKEYDALRPEFRLA